MSGHRRPVSGLSGVLVAAFVTGTLTACSPGATVNATPTPSPSEPAGTPSAGPTASESGRPPFRTMPPMGTPTPVPSGTPTPVPEVRLTAIKEDLRQRGVTAPARVVSAQSVTWSSGALGCPEPGQMYTQALEEGLQVIVEADGTQYDYRFGRSEHPKLCQPR